MASINKYHLHHTLVRLVLRFSLLYVLLYQQTSPSTCTAAYTMESDVDVDGWYPVGEEIDGTPNSFTGWSVAISKNGQTAAVASIGTYYYTGSVAVYKFVPSKASWDQVGNTITGDKSMDQFGWSLDLSADGTTLAIASIFGKSNKGYVQVYTYDQPNKTWTLLGQTIIGDLPGDESGYSIALSGDGKTIVIGSPFHDNNTYRLDTGLVRVFTYKSFSSKWVQVAQDIMGWVQGSMLGYSVAISENGQTIAVGVPFYSDEQNQLNECGRVKIFKYDSDDDLWIKIANDIDGQNTAENFGWSLSLSTNAEIVAVGAPFAASSIGTNKSAGVVRVYKLNLNQQRWIQLGQDIPGYNSYDEFGRTVSLSSDGMKVVIGAPNNYLTGYGRGYTCAYVYMQNSNLWESFGSSIFGKTIGAAAGSSLALSADSMTTIVGARWTNKKGKDAGQVRVFMYEAKPSSSPSKSPTSYPSSFPSNHPSTAPTSQPSFVPSKNPSSAPSNHPSFVPSKNPSLAPSNRPSFVPSKNPSSAPSNHPSHSNHPSYIPTSRPSKTPSTSPTSGPTNINYVRIESKILLKGNKYCLEPRSSESNSIITMSKCLSKSFKQNWYMDDIGKIHWRERQTSCIRIKQKELILAKCDIADSFAYRKKFLVSTSDDMKMNRNGKTKALALTANFKSTTMKIESGDNLVQMSPFKKNENQKWDLTYVKNK